MLCVLSRFSVVVHNLNSLGRGRKRKRPLNYHQETKETCTFRRNRLRKKDKNNNNTYTTDPELIPCEWVRGRAEMHGNHDPEEAEDVKQRHNW